MQSVIGLRVKARFDGRAMGGGTGCAESCGWRRRFWRWRVSCREMVSRDPQGKSGETVARRGLLVCERIDGGWAWVSAGGSWQEDPGRWVAGGEKSAVAGGLSGAAGRGVRAGRGLAPTGAQRASIVGCRQNWENPNDPQNLMVTVSRAGCSFLRSTLCRAIRCWTSAPFFGSVGQFGVSCRLFAYTGIRIRRPRRV